MNTMKSHQTSLQYKGLVSFSWRNCLSITKLCLGCTTNKNMSDFNKASSKSEGQFAFWERPRMILVLKKVKKSGMVGFVPWAFCWRWIRINMFYSILISLIFEVITSGIQVEWSQWIWFLVTGDMLLEVRRSRVLNCQCVKSGIKLWGKIHFWNKI